MVVVGGQLDQIILDVFSNLTDSMISLNFEIFIFSLKSMVLKLVKRYNSLHKYLKR